MNVRGRASREAVYKALREYKAEHNGKGPSHRQLMARTGLSSGAVHNAVRRLGEQGVLSKQFGEVRGIELAGEVFDYVPPAPVEIR